MQAMVQSKLMQVVWDSVVISQTLVLLWHQIGIPALCYHVGNKACYPSSGTTVEWAYLLVAGLCAGWVRSCCVAVQVPAVSARN